MLQIKTNVTFFYHAAIKGLAAFKYILISYLKAV